MLSYLQTISNHFVPIMMSQLFVQLCTFDIRLILYNVIKLHDCGIIEENLEQYN